MSTISNDAATIRTRRTLATGQANLADSIRRLSSGIRAASAADDAAGVAIYSRMEADLGGLAQAERNANDGTSMIQIAEGAMGEQQDMLVRLRDLAMQSANGTLSDSERTYIDAEAGQIVSELSRTADAAEFNGMNLLAADAGTFSMQVGNDGAAATSTIDVEFAATDAPSLGVDGMDLGSAAGARAALGTIDAAIDSLSSARATLGASQNRLGSAVESIRSEEQNLTEAASRIRDVDVAREVSNLARAQIMSEMSTAMHAQASNIPKGVLSLLGTL